MTVYTYDTEFLEDGQTIDLISIGIVCEDGREYYAVNSDFNQDRLRNDEWMVENVVANLPLKVSTSKLPSGLGYHWLIDDKSTLVKPKWVIANEVREFLLASDEPELWAYYAAYDHVALAQLYGKMIHLPQGFPMWTHDLMQALEPLQGFVKPAQDGAEHNALDDARWNMKLLSEIRRQPAVGVTGEATK